MSTTVTFLSQALKKIASEITFTVGDDDTEETEDAEDVIDKEFETESAVEDGDPVRG